MPWGFESPLSHQVDLIRTKSSLLEMGSDYFFPCRFAADKAGKHRLCLPAHMDCEIRFTA